MSNFPVISGKRFLAILLKHDFEVVRQKGGHVRVSSMDGKRKTVVPVHANRDLPLGTLKNILEDLGIQTVEYLKWL